jgi:acyl carrier protein
MNQSLNVLESEDLRAAFYAAIVEVLREGSPGLDPNSVGETDNLVDLGLIDSLRMVRLIVAVERLLDVEIPVDDLDPAELCGLRDFLDGNEPLRFDV